ncbi:MAG: hypothetical protein IJT27_07790 [Clostridia bacterium]|nr:hypothetical protein [Clostridia bacterium]
MKKHRAAALLVAITLLFSVCSSLYASAAILPFETQYDYAAAEQSWLTDLVIKENMDSVPGLGYAVELTAQPDYPYTETAESFAKKIDRYCEIYSLTERTPRASYVFLFEVLNASASSFTSQVTDETVRDYLENAGIIYPADADTDDLVFAKALYTAMVSGSYTGLTAEDADPGVSLDRALVRYLTSLSGLSEAELKKWTPNAEIASVDDYILAASRLMLWTNGYDVSVDTEASDVYRLIAVMTLKNLGVSVSATASFDELKAKYTATLLGKCYQVAVDPAKLTAARENGTAAFYMLQLLGKKEGLSVREERYGYEEAFLTVAANTDLFDVEAGEFYADIYSYRAALRYRDSYLWIYPTAYLTGNENAQIRVSVNGEEVKNNYFNRVRIDPDLPEQVITITVETTLKGKTSSAEYRITVLQGTEDYVPETVAGTEDGAEIPDSATIMSQVLARFGVSTSIINLVDNTFYTQLPSAVRTVISFIAPSFTASTISDPSEGSQSGDASAAADRAVNDTYFRGLLDKIGSAVNASISGIAGVSLGQKGSKNNMNYNFITFE